MKNTNQKPRSNEPLKKKRPRKQLSTKACCRKLPSSDGIKKPRLDGSLSPIATFKSTKDRPPTPFVHFYCNSPNYCPVSPAYCPTSLAYLPTSPPYVPTFPSYHSVSSTTLSDADTKFLELPSLWEKKIFLEVPTSQIIKFFNLNNI